VTERSRSGLRHRIAVATLLVNFALLACAPPPDRIDVILDIDCGPVKLRFQERRHVVDSFAGVVSYASEFLVDGGSGYRVADTAGHREGPEAYSTLLDPSVGYSKFPLDLDRRPRGASRSPWGLFVDPAAVPRAAYDRTAPCLAGRLDAIDAAFMKPRREGEPVSDPDQRRQITSIVYTAYRGEFETCGEPTLGSRWSCPGGAYIKTALSPRPILCAQNQPLSTTSVTTFPIGMNVGEISMDQKSITIWEPDRNSHDYRAIEGMDPVVFYAQCRDARGRGFLEVFAPSPPK